MRDFNYNAITDQHQKAVEEVLMQLQTMGKIDPITESRIKKEFKLEDPTKKDVNTSKIWNLARSYGVFCKEDGYKVCEDGNQVPQIRICGDIDTLDAFLEYARIILNDYDKENKGELELRPGEPGYVSPETTTEEKSGEEDINPPDESYLQSLVDEIDL